MSIWKSKGCLRSIQSCNTKNMCEFKQVLQTPQAHIPGLCKGDMDSSYPMSLSGLRVTAYQDTWTSAAHSCGALLLSVVADTAEVGDLEL